MAESKKEIGARSGQKVKLLRLMQILMEKTDDKHAMTVQEMIDSLESYGISAERKSIYADLEILREYGLDIISEQMNRNVYYRVASREFELAELKLLVDSVQSARFITDKKSKELIEKLTSLASMHEAGDLNRQVYRAEGSKAVNETIWYSVDAIHDAINRNRCISFQYFNWSVSKEMVLRHDGARYLVSPYFLYWDDENYYLIAYDHSSAEIRYYRVDKMLNVQMEDARREGNAQFERFDLGVFRQRTFGMFAGTEKTVELLCENKMAGIIIDRFGKDVHMLKSDADHFKAYVNVQISRQFISWIFSLGEGIKVLGPSDLVEEIQEEIRQLAAIYN